MRPSLKAFFPRGIKSVTSGIVEEACLGWREKKQRAAGGGRMSTWPLSLCDCQVNCL